ncbi:MAG: hypothetical protein C7B46_03155 [Sulfobacillus benefaciens]|uniref:Hemerythrin-like domain-containing protein n=1 Tax=Sulfobacillus benefaciens TaxID=453960 RepID=A0A2T2XKB2_9FIRM|nr:MAG: hypothetical protein C7B46_03155 [Sulfobacillus benefaciens]
MTNMAQTIRLAQNQLLARLDTTGPGVSHGVNQAFVEDLVEQFAMEENEVYPLAQSSGWTGGTAVLELKYQHQNLRQQFDHACQNPADWKIFCQQLREHFAAEDLTVLSLLDR